MNKELPELTTDLALAKGQLDEYGYCFLADALSKEEVMAARTRLEEQAAAELELDMAFEDGGQNQNWGAFQDDEGRLRRDAFTAAAGGCNQRVWMLVNKGQIFCDMLGCQPVREVVSHVMGQDYLLSSFTANIAKPGGVAMDLHTDQWWMPFPIDREPSPVPIGSLTRELSNLKGDDQSAMIAPPVVVNVMWMLNDFTAENGGTRLVPGSHLTGRRPDKVRDANVKTIAATGPAGSAMIFDGRIWHGTGSNVSDGIRLGLLTTFCGPQFRSQENFAVGTAPEVVQQASPDLLALLGLKIWNAYGRIESPVAEYIQQGETSLGILRPAKRNSPQ